MATPPNISGLGVDKDSAAPKPVAPRAVAAASRLLALAAAVQIVASVMAIGYAVSPEHLAAIQAQLDATGGTASSVESMRNLGVITVVMAGLGTVGAYLVFAVFLHKGRSWARVGAGVLVVLTLAQLVGISFPTGLTTVAQLLLGGLAVGLCYLSESNNYFAAVRSVKR